MKKALIIGASGLVGGYLYRYAPKDWDVLGTYHDIQTSDLVFLDVTYPKGIASIIDEFHPDCVLFPAAYTNVDKCEEDSSTCRLVNVDGVRSVVEAVSKTASRLVFFSTDFIFDGQNGPYSETDAAHPLSVYGETKLSGERIVQQGIKDYLIIRSTCIYGWEAREKNFVAGLIKNLNNNSECSVVRDQITSPTFAGDLAEITWKLIKSGARGIYNVAGSSLISRYELAGLAAEVFGLNKHLIKPVETKALNRPAARPLKAGLKIDKVSRELGIKIPDARSGLLKMKDERNEGKK